MRKILSAIALLISVFTYALDVECVGNATIIDNNGDTLFVFDQNPEIKSKIGVVDWYRLPDTINPIQTGTDYLYPEHGQGYAIKANNQLQTFWAFDYSLLRPQVNGVEFQQTCQETTLLIDGVLPNIQYTNEHNQTLDYNRSFRVAYMDAAWADGDWTDSLVVVLRDLQPTIVLDASPVMTDYALIDILGDTLGVADTIITNAVQPMAIKTHPQAIVTTRDPNRPNEVDRPVDPETLNRRSAPLEVEFLTNGLNTDYYEWRIYQGQTQIIKRNEAQHRYTFTEPGVYSVVLTASNTHQCSMDSVEFDVSISASMLTVPNFFSPNGDDVNDEFRVSYSSIKEFHCWVYNRWGRLVYKWDDPAKGWDGTINGRPASEGAYYYVIRALGTDAEEGYMLKPLYNKALKKQELPLGVYQLSGDINLLR